MPRTHHSGPDGADCRLHAVPQNCQHGRTYKVWLPTGRDRDEVPGYVHHQEPGGRLLERTLISPTACGRFCAQIEACHPQSASNRHRHVQAWPGDWGPVCANRCESVCESVPRRPVADTPVLLWGAAEAAGSVSCELEQQQDCRTLTSHSHSTASRACHLKRRSIVSLQFKHNYKIVF